MKPNTSHDMTKGNPLPILLTFAFPLLISNLIQQLYTMVDSMIVGQFVGANALAAVGSTGYITNIFLALSTGLSSGMGIIIAQYFGAKNDAMVRKSIVTCICLMSASALVMGTLGFIFAHAILRLMNTPDTIFRDSLLYLRINCLGMLATAVYNALSSILKATGDSKTPLFFLMIASILNLVMDLVFVILFRWSVAGVAIATILAQIFSASACIIYVIKREPYFRIPRAEWSFDKELSHRCICLGVPLALQSSMISFSNLALQRVVNGFGETVVAALTAGNRYESLIQLPLSTLNITLSTFAGQNIGVGNLRRVKQGFITGLSLAVGFVLLMMPVTLFFGSNIIQLFTNNQDVIAVGAAGIRVTAFFYLPLCIVHCTRGTINGAGDAKFPLLTGIVEVAARICLAKPITSVPAIGFRGIWLTTGLTWTFAAILGIARYYYIFIKKSSCFIKKAGTVDDNPK